MHTLLTHMRFFRLSLYAIRSNDKRGHMFRHSFRGHVLIYLFWYVHLSHSSTMGVQRRGYK